MNRLEKIEKFVADQVGIMTEAMQVADLSAKGYTLSPEDFAKWNAYRGDMTLNTAIGMLEMLLPVVRAADKLADFGFDEADIIGNGNLKEWDTAKEALYNALAEVHSTELVKQSKGGKS